MDWLAAMQEFVAAKRQFGTTFIGSIASNSKSIAAVSVARFARTLCSEGNLLIPSGFDERLKFYLALFVPYTKNVRLGVLSRLSTEIHFGPPFILRSRDQQEPVELRRVAGHCRVRPYTR